MSDPDRELIEYICSTVLADYSINKDLLLNWQIELTDNIDETLSEVIREEVIIAEPLGTFTAGRPFAPGVDSSGPGTAAAAGDYPTQTYKHFSHIIEVLEALEDEIYIDFKVIVLELLLYYANSSYAVRYQLSRLSVHDAVVDYLVRLLFAPASGAAAPSAAKDGPAPSAAPGDDTATQSAQSTLAVSQGLGISSSGGQHGRRRSHSRSRSPSVDLRSTAVPPPAQLVSQVTKLAITLLQFGCSVESLRRLVLPLFSPQRRGPAAHLHLLEIINQLFTYYPSQSDFFIVQDFQRRSSAIVALPFENDFSVASKLLSISLWFTRAANDDGPTTAKQSLLNDDHFATYSLSTLFVLSSSNSLDSSSFKVQLLNGKQFRVELLNKKSNSRMQFSFNQQIQHRAKNQGFTHLALTYDTYKNLNLFIDGEYSESIPCPEIYRVIHTWNKIYIGKNENDSEAEEELGGGDFGEGDRNGGGELILRQLTVLNAELTPAWINLLYNLGLGYSWGYKDLSNENIFHLLNQLTFSGLVNFALKVAEIRGRPQAAARGGNGSGSGSNGGGGGGCRVSGLLPDHHHPGQSNSHFDELHHQQSYRHSHHHSSASSSIHPAGSAPSQESFIDRASLVSFLAKDKPKQENVLFDTAGNIALSNSTTSHSRLLYHSTSSIHTALFAMGGSSLLLRLVEIFTKSDYSESSSRDATIDGVCISLEFLFRLINTNWRFAREFEDLNGYGILLVLLNQYKDSANGRFDPRILQVVLTNVGICEENEGFDSIIINSTGYRSLVLNDLWIKGPKVGDSVKEKWHRHFQLVLNRRGRYFEVNSLEIARLRGLIRYIQILKSQQPTSRSSTTEIDRPSSPVTPTHGIATGIRSRSISTTNDLKKSSSGGTAAAVNSAAERALYLLLENDNSIEAIRSLSLYSVYAIYYFPVPQCLPLQTLTAFLTGTSSTKTLKKFSKSISIHWILLLLDYHANPEYSKCVTTCGLQLLVKLLAILGPNTIKRFFQANHGIDILTHFLKDWWKDDDIVKLVYNAAFEVEIGGGSDKKLIMPDFLMILNNIALNSVYTSESRSSSRMNSPFASPRQPKVRRDLPILSPVQNGPYSRFGSISGTTYDVIHFLNYYADILERGFNGNNHQLKAFYSSKEWLDGIFELIAQIKLMRNTQIQEEDDLEVTSQIELTYNRMCSIVSTLFVSEISNPKVFFKIFKSLNEFTRKLVLDTIFPLVFDHINQFVAVEQEKEFIEGSVELLNFYVSDFFDQGYMVGVKDLETFINCSLSIVEVNEKGISKLIDSIGPLIIMAIVQKQMKQTEPEQISNYNFLITSLLYKLVPILKVLKFNELIDLICILLGIFIQFQEALLVDDSAVGNLFNLLRMFYLSSQERFNQHNGPEPSSSSGENKNIIEFLEVLTTRNDDDSLKYFQRHATLRHIIGRNYQLLKGKIGREHFKLNVLDMASVIGDGISWKNNVFVETCQRDCESLETSIIDGEILKFNRLVQDQQENVQYCVSNYHGIKVEVARLIDINKYESGAEYVLDYIEGADRMRKRLVVEDQLSESEKLSYNTSVPVKSSGSAQPTDMERRGSGSRSRRGSGLAGSQSINLGTPGRSGNRSDSISLDEIEWEVVVDDDNRSLNHSDDFEMIEELPTDKNRKVIRSLFMGDHIVNLWNISQINGLAPIESLMILGKSHLYLIENYFHSPDGGGVVEVADVPISLRDPYLQLVNSQSKNQKQKESNSHRRKTWSLDKFTYISKRHFLLRDVALEMFFNDGASILITCLSTRERDATYKVLNAIVSRNTRDKQSQQSIISLQSQLSVSSISKFFGGDSTSYQAQNNGANGGKDSVSSMTSPFTISLSEATNKWRHGEMSNFYYLMIINTLAGRTFNDLTQYPVFPWVISDYTSDTLDLTNPKSFRDLSKPMGAQTPERANQFKERYEALASLCEGDGDENPPFHYGTHYSSAMIVTSYLIRLKPYVQSYLLLQGGKFDHADRLFSSLEKAWKSASKDNTTDVRELTPEFFYLPEFLTNHNQFEFGKLQGGESVNDVALPPWSKNDPQIFIEMNRRALESPYVSAHLHHWIELIFGFKQNGPEAVKSLNVFHHLSYNGAINLDNIKDEVEKRAVIGMINNFGQTPRKIFNKPHPKREIFNFPNYYLSTPSDYSDSVKGLVFESKTRQPINSLEISSKKKSHGKSWVGRQKFISCEDDLVVRKTSWGSGSLIINNTTFLNVHSANITSILQIGNKTILAGSEDGIINVWKHIKKSNALEVSGILRGHFHSIKDVKYSNEFKIAVSLDVKGVIIVWDLARLKFMRRIGGNKLHPQHITISKDTGNICVLYEGGTIEIYTINGDLILSSQLEVGESGEFTSITYGANCQGHIYWSTELIGIGRSDGKVEVYSISCDDGDWVLKRICKSSSSTCSGYPTVLEIEQYVDIDPDDKLARGRIKIVVGDSKGRVYDW